MKFLWVTFIVLLFSSTAFAQVVITPIGDSTDGTVNTDLQIAQRLAVIESKINGLPSSEQMAAAISGTNQAQLEKFGQIENEIIVFAIVIAICQIALFFGILFWLKSEGKF